MVKLFCAMVGVVGSAFSVRIDEDDSVDDLKKAIKAEKMYQFPADQLQLFLAKTDGGGWLSSKDPDVILLRSGGIPAQVNALLDVGMDPADEIGDLFGAAPTKKTIHVLVVVDRESLEAQEPAIAPHPSRKRRWDKLNKVLDKNKKAKTSVGPSGFSYVSFREINNIMPAARFEQTSKPIPDEKLDAVHGYLPIFLKAFGDIEAQRVHFIVPVLASVCALFDGDVRILAEGETCPRRWSL